jgi:CheY-like chemotaxis protein
MNILILDDECKKSSSMAEMINDLREDGVLIVCTETPQEAEEELTKRSFDVILLDGNLDVDDRYTGPSVLRHWKKRGLTLPPILMWTSSLDMQQEGVASGACGVMDKLGLCIGGTKAVALKIKI